MISPEAGTFVKVPIGFPPEMYEWLRETAFRRHVSMAVVVREALLEYRERIDPQMTLPLRVQPQAEQGRPPK
jgi:hypothetical protein